MNKELIIDYSKQNLCKIYISDSIFSADDSIFANLSTFYQNLTCDRRFMLIDSNVYSIYADDVSKFAKNNSVSISVIDIGEDITPQMANLIKENDFCGSSVSLCGGCSLIEAANEIFADMNFDEILIPTTLASIVRYCIDDNHAPSYATVSLQFIKTLPHRYISSAMAEVLKYALLRDGMFYEWLIMNFNEILDCNFDALFNMIDKTLQIKNLIYKLDPKGTKERFMLGFGEIIGEGLKNCLDTEISDGSATALGIIAESYISYQRSFLDKDEFYELRDMFVPFGLAISLDPFDKQKVIDYIIENYSDEIGLIKMTALKKIGKATIFTDVTKDEIDKALEELIVEWD